MSRRNWNRITRLEQSARDATPPAPCRVCIGEPTADDLACGLELIQIAVVDGRVTR